MKNFPHSEMNSFSAGAEAVSPVIGDLTGSDQMRTCTHRQTAAQKVPENKSG